MSKNLRSLAVFALLTGVVAAQPVVFFTEPFDNNNAGWTFSANTEWGIGPATASTGQTTACGNGDPGVDGTGAAGGGVAGVVIGGNAAQVVHAPDYIISPALDTTVLAGVQVSFDRWLNSDYANFMINYIDVWDGSAWVNVWQTGPAPGVQDSAWTTQTFNMTAYSNPAFQVRIGFEIGSTGVYLCSSWNIDNFTIADPGPPDYQLNNSASSLDIDGVQASEYVPAIVSKDIVNCGTGLSPATGTLNISSAMPGTLYDVGLNSANIVPLSGLGVMVGSNVLNLRLASGISFMYGGAVANLQSFPGAGFPGVTNGSATIPFSTMSPTDTSIQGLFVNAAMPNGYRLSQATEFHAAITMGATSVPGPTLDEEVVAIDVTAAPTCWTTGIPFYGTTFTQIHVSSNGRVLFQSALSDFSPTVAEALTGVPFAGFWTDLNPGTNGSVTVSNPANNVVRVDYNAVPYSGTTTNNTFGIEFDATIGLVTIDGLGGILPQTGTFGSGDDQLLGISPGTLLAATDPGNTVFTANGSGTAGLSTDMLLEFYDSTLGGGMIASVLAGTSTIFFAPDPTNTPNYQWAAQ